MYIQNIADLKTRLKNTQKNVKWPMAVLTGHVSVVKRNNTGWKFLFFLFLILALSSCDSTAAKKVDKAAEVKTLEPHFQEFPKDTRSRIRSYFDSLHSLGNFSGVLLMYRDGMLDSFALGYRNIPDKEGLKSTDQFQLASLTKPFTALAILKLISDNRIDLDDSVSMYLPCTPYGDVSIRQLLTHTSGIGYYAYVTDSLWGKPENYMQNSDLKTMFECSEIPRYFTPGRQFDYCNTNYVLLADIIEAESGKSYSEFMTDEVFLPLGMNESDILSVFQKPPENYKVRGHFANGRRMEPSYLDGVSGDKGVYSTVGDLFMFYRQFEEMPIVEEQLWSEARSKQVRTKHQEGYGFGWRITEMEKDTLVYHNGWWRGFRSYFWTSTNTDKVVIILTNSLKGGYLKKKEIWKMF